ncbi:MAG: MTH865 family protein [Halodesulfurarchaeum sp.]
MADPETELRESFTEVYDDADYPVESHTDLIPLLPKGPLTTFKGGDVSVSAMALGMKYGSHLEFPYQSCQALVDDIMDALREEETI